MAICSQGSEFGSCKNFLTLDGHTAMLHAKLSVTALQPLFICLLTLLATDCNAHRALEALPQIGSSGVWIH